MSSSVIGIRLVVTPRSLNAAWAKRAAGPSLPLVDGMAINFFKEINRFLLR